MFKTPRLPRFHVPTVTSWMLWRHLIAAPAHPLFKHTLDLSQPRLASTHLGCIAPLVLSTLACCGVSTVPLLRLGTIPPYFLAVIVLASTVYVGLWAVDTSVLIARERERNTYDLLCVAPSGPLGVHWALCATSLHRKNMLGWIDVVRVLVAGGLLLVFVTGVLNVTIFLPLLPDMVSLAVASYLEHSQATVLGCLIGMHTPLLTASVAAARVWAGLAFAALQLGTVLASVVGVYAVRLILPAGTRPLIFGLLIFFLIREGIVIALWRSLAHQLNTAPAHVDLALD